MAADGPSSTTYSEVDSGSGIESQVKLCASHLPLDSLGALGTLGGVPHEHHPTPASASLYHFRAFMVFILVAKDGSTALPPILRGLSVTGWRVCQPV